MKKDPNNINENLTSFLRKKNNPMLRGANPVENKFRSSAYS